MLVRSVGSAKRAVRLIYVLFTVAGAFGANQVLAQAAFPSKNIKIIVPVTTGGPSDLVARILARELETSMGKPMIIENRPGASQTVGANAVAKAEPDGYTLLQAAANMAINPFLMSDLPYDTLKDFAPISLTHMTPYVFVVSVQSSITSLADLFKTIRANPGKLSYGTTGPGSPQQLATLLLAQQLNLPEMTEVQYKGSSAAHPDLIANRVSFMVDPLAAAGPAHQVGSLACAGGDHPAAQWRVPGDTHCH